MSESSFVQPLCRLLQTAGLSASAFASAEDFLRHFDPGPPGCLLLDMQLRGASGLEVLAEIGVRGVDLPAIAFSEHVSIPDTVRAVKLGAIHVWETPLDFEDVLRQIRQALDALLTRRQNQAAWAVKIGSLSPRELEVMQRLVQGQSTGQIVNQLGIRPSAVGKHRVRILEKLGVDSVVGLVRLFLKG